MSSTPAASACLAAPLTRHRASSTTLRPALTLKSLGRRRSASSLQPLPQSLPQSPHSSQATTPALDSQSSPSMLVLVVSRVLQWIHLHPKHPEVTIWESPSSPRSSEDDFALPLPASATKASFGDVVNENPPFRHQWFHGLPSLHAPILLVISLFPLSTAFVFLALRTLPVSFSWPKTITDLAELGRDLHGYSKSGPWPMAHVIGIMAITAVWKHAWSIPGSVIWNVLAGALFSPALATILLAILTTIGSLCATLLSAPLSPFIMYLFPKVLDMTRSALEGDVPSLTSESKSQSPNLTSTSHSGAWVRLSVLRLVGVVPWSGINIACGVCGVSLWDCMLGSFIGTLPWTAVTCQIGDILQTVASTPSPTPQTVSSVLLSPDIIIKLVCLSFLSLAPILARDRLKALISPASSADNTTSESKSDQDERASRWTWVKEWRARLPSRSRTREAREKVQRMRRLDVLIDEKRQIQIREDEMLPS